MNHVVLLGDSILDNGAYVRKNSAVIDQLRDELPPGWRATLLAVDGSVTRDVHGQLRQLPADATHLVVSAGGNDALDASGLLTMRVRSAAEVFAAVADARERFAADYRAMLDAALARELPTAVCTIYDGRADDPADQRMQVAGLTIFNDVITREAVRRELPVVDLRVLFTDPADYANPIEPSAFGGAKIARVVRVLVTAHDFDRGAVFYGGATPVR